MTHCTSRIAIFSPHNFAPIVLLGKQTIPPRFCFYPQAMTPVAKIRIDREWTPKGT